MYVYGSQNEFVESVKSIHSAHAQSWAEWPSTTGCRICGSEELKMQWQRKREREMVGRAPRCVYFPEYIPFHDGPLLRVHEWVDCFIRVDTILFRVWKWSTSVDISERLTKMNQNGQFYESEVVSQICYLYSVTDYVPLAKCIHFVLSAPKNVISFNYFYIYKLECFFLLLQELLFAFTRARHLICMT